MTKEEFTLQCQLIISGALVGYTALKPIETKDVTNIVLNLIMPEIKKSLSKLEIKD